MIDKIEEFCLNILRKIKLEKLADWYMQHQEGMRYLIFGALATVVNLAVKYILLFTILDPENARSITNSSNYIMDCCLPFCLFYK